MIHLLFSLATLTGRFHPLLVHLPLGILLAALALHWFSNRPAYAAWRPAVSPLLLAGALTAIASCISGYLLKRDGGYDEDLLGKHQWAGIATAVTDAGFTR